MFVVKWLSMWKFMNWLLITTLLCTNVVSARKHHLQVRFDTRPYIALSTFGFFTGGHLDVKLSKLVIEEEDVNEKFGLTLDKTTIDQMNPYLDSHQNKCILEERSTMQRSGPILFFLFDLKRQQVTVQCSPEWTNLHIYKDHSEFPMYRGKRDALDKVSDSTLFKDRRKRASIGQNSDNHIMNLGDKEAGTFFDDDSVEEPTLSDTQVDDSKISVPQKPLGPGIMEKQLNQTAHIAVKPTSEVPRLSPVPPIIGKPEIQLDKKQEARGHSVHDIQTNEELENKLMKSEDTSDSEEEAAQDQAAIHQDRLETAAQPKLHRNNDGFTLNPYYPQENSHSQLCRDYTLPLNKDSVNGVNYYSMSFSMLVTSLRDEGLYNLYFHSCRNYVKEKWVSFDVDIEEKNNGNFLSAGEMPLPALYFMMSLLFFLSGLFWLFILKKSKNNVYKLHYIMAVLVFLKSLSLMFHSINYHFIEVRGEHVEAWAILYYIAHLLKGAVLFITIVLIGTGWTFIKHILSDKDKKIFMIVIPLQVLANVAEIIIDESEESDVEFRTWRNIFIFVDLLCCGAILFPIVWSIRHLHEASATDGKAAINLRKLKLFRQFYIMIVCYIYFTRIIVYLLKMTVAFQYAWLDEMFHELATFVFFVLTGYKFRPASSHPYFSLANDDPDDEEVEVLTQSGLTQGLHRTKALNRNAPPTTVIEGNDEEHEKLITKRESSHEYD